MKYLICFESFVGNAATFVAKDKSKGFGYGAGFVLQRKNEKNKWIGNINCAEGTKITGEVISEPNEKDVIKLYKLKLPDGSYVNIDLDFFEKEKI